MSAFDNGLGDPTLAADNSFGGGDFSIGTDAGAFGSDPISAGLVGSADGGTTDPAPAAVDTGVSLVDGPFGYLIDSSTGNLYDPNTGAVVLVATTTPTISGIGDPFSTINPDTGQIDGAPQGTGTQGWYQDPATGVVVDRATGKIYDPGNNWREVTDPLNSTGAAVPIPSTSGSLLSKIGAALSGGGGSSGGGLGGGGSSSALKPPATTPATTQPKPTTAAAVAASSTNTMMLMGILLVAAFLIARTGGR